MEKLISFIKIFDPSFVEAKDITKATISSFGGGSFDVGVGVVGVLAVTGDGQVFHIRWNKILEKGELIRRGEKEDLRNEYDYSRYKIAVLSGKGIQDFHMRSTIPSCVEIALTKDNWIYTWMDSAPPFITGKNPMVALPKEEMELKTFILRHGFKSKITQISAGARQALALDEDGDVYTLGYHSTNKSPDNKQSPVADNADDFKKMKGLPKKIVQIDCSLFNSYALTEDGEVYGWGSINQGMLVDVVASSRMCGRQEEPEIVKIQDCKISKISCSEFFVLALTEDGKVYSWGVDLQRESNSVDKFVTMPKKLVGISLPVLDIYAAKNSAFCATKTHVYAWGLEFYPSPTILPFATIQEALASCWDTVDVTVTVTKRSEKLNEKHFTLDGLLNDERDADVEFILDGGSHKAHSTILSFRSSIFREKFSSNWETGKTQNYTVKLDHPLAAFKAFLRFLYTGKWEIDSAVLKEVLKISEIYGDAQLKKEFARHMTEQIQDENAFTLYSHYFLHQFPVLHGNIQERFFLYIWNHWDKLKENQEIETLDKKPLEELKRRIKWRMQVAEKKRAQEIKEVVQFGGLEGVVLPRAIFEQMQNFVGY